MVAYAQRPNEISGCWSFWSEQEQLNIIRTSMENGSPKIRRRFTGIYRIAQVSVTEPKELSSFYKSWFNLACQQGVMPTNIFEPDGVQSVWRFTEAPIITFSSPLSGTVEISAKLERLPGWQVL